MECAYYFASLNGIGSKRQAAGVVSRFRLRLWHAVRKNAEFALINGRYRCTPRIPRIWLVDLMALRVVALASVGIRVRIRTSNAD